MLKKNFRKVKQNDKEIENKRTRLKVIWRSKSQMVGVPERNACRNFQRNHLKVFLELMDMFQNVMGSEDAQ